MNHPRFLLIETSQQPGFVALTNGVSLLAVRRLDEARRHARDLAPAISDLLTNATWHPRDITAVVVSLGPGSYTGLRVGVMSAKTFAFATRCKLIGVETFAVIAAQTPPAAGRLAVISDAQQDQVYVQEFEGGCPVSLLRIQAFQQWLEGIAIPMGITGPGLRKWASKLPPHVLAVDPSCWDPRPESLLQIGLDRHQRNDWTDVLHVEPIYLRPSAAEEQLVSKTSRLT